VNSPGTRHPLREPYPWFTSPPFESPGEENKKTPFLLGNGVAIFLSETIFSPAWIKEGYRRAKLLFQPKRLWRKQNMLSIRKFVIKINKNIHDFNNFPAYSWCALSSIWARPLKGTCWSELYRRPSPCLLSYLPPAPPPRIIPSFAHNFYKKYLPSMCLWDLVVD